MRNAYWLSIAVTLTFSLFVPLLASATEQSDIVSGLNVLPLMMNKITGDTVMAVIYDPASEISRNDAQAIQKIVDAGIGMPGGGKLTALPVSAYELGKLARARIAFLTPGLESHLSDISIAASAASILTFSTDIECVRLARCIIGMVSKPSVTIYFSRAAADSAKLEFSQSFSMLVKQP